VWRVFARRGGSVLTFHHCCGVVMFVTLVAEIATQNGDSYGCDVPCVCCCTVLDLLLVMLGGQEDQNMRVRHAT
jgi:hypothetical protein